LAKSNYGKKYDRLFVAMATPFKKNFQVDEAELRKLLKYFMQPKFVKAGGGVIINPEAGEIFYLSKKEKRRNIEIALEEVGGKVPVFTGVTDLRTDDAVKGAIDAKECGVDGIFILPPMGSGDVSTVWDPMKYPEVWIDMVKAQDNAVNLPIIIHPVAPGGAVFGQGLPLDPTLKMCKAVPNIVGWKMTYAPNGWNLIAGGLRSLDRHVGILAAPANQFHHNLADNLFDGTVSGSFNYAMESMIDHINAWRNKEYDKAMKIWHGGLGELHTYVIADLCRLHIRYKIATWLRGLVPHPFMIPPQPKPMKQEILKLHELLTKCGLSVIPLKEAKKLADAMTM
jgi:4-hydroxy-tetrahydrodipicolinate synthase